MRARGYSLRNILDAHALALAGWMQYGLACLLTPLARLFACHRRAVDDLYDVRFISGLFREPELFRILPEYLDRRFPDGADVYCYAAASGAEPFSIVMKLLDAWGEEKATRFLPVQARDINADLMEFARKEGLLYLFPDDLEDYRKAGMRAPARRFLQRDRTIRNIGGYRAGEAIRRHVHFASGDLREDARQPFARPAVILFRNGWYHLRSPWEALALCRNLYEHLPPGSAVIVGAVYLEKHGYTRLLEAAGFRRAGHTPPWMQIHERP